MFSLIFFIILFGDFSKYNVKEMKKFFYRVESEDDVLSVSRKFLVPVGRIIFLNRLEKEIEEGDLLDIEKSDYKVYFVKAA